MSSEAVRRPKVSTSRISGPISARATAPAPISASAALIASRSPANSSGSR